ncbi:MAG: hypothetical protein NTW74_04090 [Acidobacteria bacterium]|nr:hypothetical protein [Acidobacteriota bacterium]
MRSLISAILATFIQLSAQQGIMPLAQIKPDMAGVARTVFRGQDPEEFPLRILGVLQNSGPGQNLILARLLTARLEQTGVMQGMSGSPVYIEGKLVGAIAFAFPFAKEPIAGIRPIEEMLQVERSQAAIRAESIHLGSRELVAGKAQSETNQASAVLTPISFAGMTERTAQHFASQWRQLGFAVQQGASGSQPAGATSPLRPGDMISVQLIRGDMNSGADGTVTHIAGNQVYAFGHRFLGGGAVDFPFAKAEVITSMPNLNMPFKISQSLKPVGTIFFDGEAAVKGELGRAPKLVPITIRYRDAAGLKEYKMEMVRHSLLSPLLLQMALFSTLDSHFRSAGSGTVDLKGEIRFPGQAKPLEIEGRYSGDNNLPVAASLGAAIPFAFFQQHVEETLLPESMTFDLVANTKHEQWVIESASASRRSAKPGDTLTIRTQLSSPNGVEKIVEHQFTVPSWLPGGETLTFTVADSFITNLLDFRSFYQPGGPVFRSTAELIRTLGTLHPANAMYVRVFRSSPAFQSGGRKLSNLPPSIASTLQKTPGTYLPIYQSRLFDRETRLPDGVVSGSRTFTLEIEK